MLRRIILLLTVAAMMSAMLVASAAPAFASHAPGSFFTASTAVLAEPTNPNSLHAERGLSTAFMHNRNP